jgi:hypothetical protein
MPNLPTRLFKEVPMPTKLFFVFLSFFSCSYAFSSPNPDLNAEFLYKILKILEENLPVYQALGQDGRWYEDLYDKAEKIAPANEKAFFTHLKCAYACLPFTQVDGKNWRLPDERLKTFVSQAITAARDHQGNLLAPIDKEILLTLISQVLFPQETLEKTGTAIAQETEPSAAPEEDFSKSFELLDIEEQEPELPPAPEMTLDQVRDVMRIAETIMHTHKASILTADELAQRQDFKDRRITIPQWRENLLRQALQISQNPASQNPASQNPEQPSRSLSNVSLFFQNLLYILEHISAPDPGRSFLSFKKKIKDKSRTKHAPLKPKICEKPCTLYLFLEDCLKNSNLSHCAYAAFFTTIDRVFFLKTLEKDAQGRDAYEKEKRKPLFKITKEYTIW